MADRDEYEYIRLAEENERLRALLVEVAGASHIPGAPLSLLEMYHPAYSCEAPLVCGTCTVRAKVEAALSGREEGKHGL